MDDSTLTELKVRLQLIIDFQRSNVFQRFFGVKGIPRIQTLQKEYDFYQLETVLFDFLLWLGYNFDRPLIVGTNNSPRRKILTLLLDEFSNLLVSDGGSISYSKKTSEETKKEISFYIKNSKMKFRQIVTSYQI